MPSTHDPDDPLPPLFDDDDQAGTEQRRMPLIRIVLIVASLLAAVLLILQFTSRDSGLVTGTSASAATPGPGEAAQVVAQAQPTPVKTAPAPGPVGRASGLSVSAQESAVVVEIALDRAVPYRIFALTSPTRRLVVDTGRLNFRFPQADAGRIAGTGAVSAVRFAQKSDTQSRFVIDLAEPVAIVSHEMAARVGGRTLRITLAPASEAAFAAIRPVAAGTMPGASTAATAAAAVAPARKDRYTIVIDAGHGGRDPGASGTSETFREKHATLASALLLRDYLREDRRFNVILTRETDIFLTLEQRITIARDRRADLFISLHADAAPATARVNGATVYTLSSEGAQRSRRLLDNENWDIVPESAAGDAEVTDILRDLTRRDTTNQSSIFAQVLLGNLGRVGPLTRSSHRTAGFFVLLSPTVPAVLLEMGFMTDREDEARLQDPAFRQRQMRATAEAIRTYFDARPGSTAAKGAKQ